MYLCKRLWEGWEMNEGKVDINKKLRTDYLAILSQKQQLSLEGRKLRSLTHDGSMVRMQYCIVQVSLALG